MHTVQSHASEELCRDLDDPNVVQEIGNIARRELHRQGITIDKDVDRDIVTDCRDFFVFSLRFNPDVMGGIPYVFISHQGNILWVYETM